MKKLHLGSGGLVLDGYINTDVMEMDGVDMALDASVIPYPFEDNTLDEVCSSHMIEHIWHEFIPPMIDEWYRILKPGGVCIVEAPDFDAAIKLYVKGETKRALDMFYGNNERPSQHHQWGWSYNTLKPLFMDARFSEIHEEESNDYHKVNFDIPTFKLVATK